MVFLRAIRFSSLRAKLTSKTGSVRLDRHLSSVSYAQAVANLPETKVTTLSNGLRVASENSGSPACTVGVWIDAGTRYERDETNGVAHFLEHMAFKGTAKRPQKELELEIENMGGHLNAYTSKEQTAFYAKCLSKDLSKAVDILSDIIQNRTFDDKSIEQERKVILREVDEMESNLKESVFEYLHAAAYQGTPLARTLRGPVENIKKISSQDLIDYIANNFIPPRIVLAGAGGIDHDELVKLAEKHFGSMKITYEGKIPSVDPVRYTGSDIRYRYDSFPLVHAAVAVETAGWSDPDYIPLSVASSIIGKWDRSCGGGVNVIEKLASELCEKNICHSFQSFNTCYKDTGLWGIYLVSSESHTYDREYVYMFDMMTALQENWKSLCIYVTDGEVDRAKNSLKTNIFQQLQETSATCEDIGRQMLAFGRRMSYQELEEKIESVNAQKIHEVCNKHIYDRCPAVASLGPVEGFSDYLQIRSGMWWFRW